MKTHAVHLRELLGREPTDDEIAISMGCSQLTVRRIRLSDLQTVSLQDTAGTTSDGGLGEIVAGDVPSPDAILGRTDSLQRLGDLLDQLDVRESLILRLRFGLNGMPPQTLETVSVRVGITRERVRQLQNRALAKLRAKLISDMRGVTT